MTNTADNGFRKQAVRIVLIALAFMAFLLAGAWWMSRPATPDAFFDPPQRAAAAGTLLRSENFDRATPAGAKAWRILYATTRADGRPAVASAIVMAPATQSSSARPVIAWAHGTSGIDRGCAPSLFPNPYLNVPAVSHIVANGWVYVATDYTGLGTQGGHAYLVGEDAARAVLDSLRAARQISGLHLDDRNIVWGHSQGGHSALWTGILAPTYAPDVSILGIAALAPATDLSTLLPAAQSSLFGKMVSAYLVHAYDRTYPDTHALSYLKPAARVLVDDIAGRCVGGWESLFSVLEAIVLPQSGVFARPPTEGTFGKRLAQNVPRAHIAAPLLIVQGGADDQVLPGVQSAYVAAQCAAGQRIDYRIYPRRNHLSVLAADGPLTHDLVNWTRDRLSGIPARSTCHGKS